MLKRLLVAPCSYVSSHSLVQIAQYFDGFRMRKSLIQDNAWAKAHDYSSLVLDALTEKLRSKVAKKQDSRSAFHLAAAISNNDYDATHLLLETFNNLEISPIDEYLKNGKALINHFDLNDLILHIETRPGIYLNDNGFQYLNSFLSGLYFGLATIGRELRVSPSLQEFASWLAIELDIDTCVPWFRLIEYESMGRDQYALEVFFSRFKQWRHASG